MAAVLRSVAPLSPPVHRGAGALRLSAEPAAPVSAADDWNLLFNAVTTRLRRVASGAGGPPANVNDAVLDCVHALTQLQALLGAERQWAERVAAQLSDTRALLASAHDQLSGTQARERHALHQAEHDSLTALPNGSLFRRRLDQALHARDSQADDARTPALAVLFVDLDDFKPINDHHGHDTGDALLRIVAHRLQRAVRAGDMVCRLGGDEFACLLTDPMGHTQLSRLASQLFDAVSAPLQVGALQLAVRPSIGIAVSPDDGDTSTTLLQRADAAMYRAKRGQLGYAFYDPEADTLSSARMAWA